MFCIFVGSAKEAARKLTDIPENGNPLFLLIPSLQDPSDVLAEIAHGYVGMGPSPYFSFRKDS